MFVKYRVNKAVRLFTELIKNSDLQSAFKIYEDKLMQHEHLVDKNIRAVYYHYQFHSLGNKDALQNLLALKEGEKPTSWIFKAATHALDVEKLKYITNALNQDGFPFLKLVQKEKHK